MATIDPVTNGVIYTRNTYGHVSAPKVDNGDTTYSYDLNISASQTNIPSSTRPSNTANINLTHDGNDGICTLSSTTGNTYITGTSIPRDGVSADVANKEYVDSRVLIVKDEVRLATTSALPSYIVTVGNELTAVSTGQLTIDGVGVNINDRILVKDEPLSNYNGVYAVTQPGDGASTFLLTRATDFNTSVNMTNNSSFLVREGLTNNLKTYILSIPYTVVAGITNLVFKQVSHGLGDIPAGDGLYKSGNTLNVTSDQPTITSIGTGSSLLTINKSGTVTDASPAAGGIEFSRDEFIALDGRTTNQYGQPMYFAPSNVNGTWRMVCFQNSNGKVNQTKIAFEQKRNNGNWSTRMTVS